jgi:hypothetical protein
MLTTGTILSIVATSDADWDRVTADLDPNGKSGWDNRISLTGFKNFTRIMFSSLELRYVENRLLCVD